MKKDGSRGNDDRTLMRVIKFSSAFSLGIMAALLYSIKQVNPTLQYEISWGTAVSFAMAVAFSWAYWRLLFGKQNDLNGGLPKTKRRWLLALSVFLAVGTVVPFVYALKDVAADEASDVAQGTAIALVVLGAVGFLFWRVTRYLDADTRRDGEAGETPHRPE
ncbi:MAG TPA: hypothetical protein VEL06_04320 [Haliangiales bacterium]|nr:hypothetical protein [Haliangiales bacterium]